MRTCAASVIVVLVLVWLAVLSCYDIRERRLPNLLTLPGAGVILLAGAVAGPGGYPTRSAMGVRAAAARYPDGAVWVIGCAPTALAELVAQAASGLVRPALIIGLPVGFVGAAEAKQAARGTDLAVISNVGEKGGSAVAAAAFNAVLRLSQAVG